MFCCIVLDLGTGSRGGRAAFQLSTLMVLATLRPLSAVDRESPNVVGETADPLNVLPSAAMGAGVGKKRLRTELCSL